MRRVLIFAAFLLLLGLTTAAAASFDVQAEDVTSFSQPVTITIPGEPIPTGTVYFMIDDPPHATLTPDEPLQASGNEKAQFPGTSDPLGIEDRPPSNGNDYYVVWSRGTLDEGAGFTQQTVRVHFFRTAGVGSLTAGLFECTAGAAQATLTSSGCRLFGTGSSGADTWIDIPLVDGNVEPGRELRLKMVNTSGTSANIQWGYKSNNRPGRLEVLAGLNPPPPTP